MGRYDPDNKNKGTSPSTGRWVSSENLKSADIQKQREERISKGLPVAVNKKKVAPTMAGSILRDILKVPATLLARPAQAIAAIKGYTPEEQTVKSKYLGDIKTSQTGKDVLSDVGRGLELASYGVGLGAGKSLLAQTGKQSAKTIAKNAAIGEGLAGLIGSSGRVITDQSGDLKQDLKTIAGGTGLGALGGGGLGYLGGRFGGKVLSAEERAAQKAFGESGKPFIPESGAPKVVEPEIVATPPKMVIPEVTPKNQFELRAKNTPTKEEFIGSEISFLNKTKQKVPSNLQEKASKTWDSMHPQPVEDVIPGVSKEIPSTTQAIQEQPKYQVTNVPIESLPERATAISMPSDDFNKMASDIKQNGVKQPIVIDKNTGQVMDGQRRAFVAQQLGIKDIPAIHVDSNEFNSLKEIQDLSNNFGKTIPEQPTIKEVSVERINEARRAIGGVDEADAVTFKKSIERFDQLIKEDSDYVKKLAMGTSTEKDPILRDFWALKLMEKHADDTGNTALSYELSLSKVGREAGRELVGGKIVGEETTADVIRFARKERAKNIGVSEDSLIKEEKTIFDNLKKDMSNNKPSKVDSDDIINSIIC